MKLSSLERHHKNQFYDFEIKIQGNVLTRSAEHAASIFKVEVSEVWILSGYVCGLQGMWPIISAIGMLRGRWPIIPAIGTLEGRWPIIPAIGTLQGRWPVIQAIGTLQGR